MSWERMTPLLVFSDLWGLTLTGTPASWASPSNKLLSLCLPVSTRMSPLWRCLTDLSVPIWAWSTLPRAKGESLERERSELAASVTSHLGKTDVVLLSVSESSDPGDNRLFCCRVADDDEGFFCVHGCYENFQQCRPTPATESQQGARGPS